MILGRLRSKCSADSGNIFIQETKGHGFFFRKSIFCNFPCNMFHFRSKGLGPIWAHFMHLIIKKPGRKLRDDLGHYRTIYLQQIANIAGDKLGFFPLVLQEKNPKYPVRPDPWLCSKYFGSAGERAGLGGRAGLGNRRIVFRAAPKQLIHSLHRRTMKEKGNCSVCVPAWSWSQL